MNSFVRALLCVLSEREGNTSVACNEMRSSLARSEGENCQKMTKKENPKREIVSNRERIEMADDVGMDKRRRKKMRRNKRLKG